MNGVNVAARNCSPAFKAGSGTDFDFGTIVEGAEIICNYTLDDAGSIKLEIEIPAIREDFHGNFYVRQDAQVDFNKEAHKVNRDGEKLLDRVRDIGSAVNDDDYEKLEAAGDLASEAISADNSTHDAEKLKHLEEQLAAARKTLADIRERNKFTIRRSDLNGLRGYYKKDLKRFAEPQEIEQLETLFTRAETLIERDDTAFDDTFAEIRHLCFLLLIRDDEFIAYKFNQLAKHPENVTDRESFYRLVQAGNAALARKDFDELRQIIGGLLHLSGHTEDEFLSTNITKA
ncbi:MAG: hypothetical protein IJ774_13440 [Selenomonadaceae bacterium]|nr:hypothetical protein [Selenomonadaceae bacterium]